MATATYQGYLAYYDGSTWNMNEAAQGRYGSALRIGVIKWSGNLKGKVVKSVKLTVKSSAAGNPATDTKTAYFYKSAYQSINTDVTGLNHIQGDLLGSVSGKFYSNTLTISADFLKESIADGENTFCLYVSESNQSGVNWSKNYFKWTSVTIAVEWENPPTPTAPTSITPAYGTTTYYHNNHPTIAWSGATNASSYTVERAISTTTQLDNWSVIATGIESETFIDSDSYLVGKGVYGAHLGDYVRYRVKAVSADGLESAYRTSGNIRRMLPQEEPTNITVNVTRTSVALAWNAETAPIATFWIECSINGGDYEEIAKVATTSFVHNVSNLPDGSTLRYRIRLAQQSPEDDSLMIMSAYSDVLEVKMLGGISLKTDAGVKRGMVYQRTSAGAVPMQKAFVKTENGWKRSV